jgi:uncharacterized protein YcbX
MTSSSARIDAIYRYPVKGLAAESLDRIAVAAGEGVPGDRRYAIARGGTRWDDARPQWLRKESFVMLMRAGDEALAALGCGYTENGQVLVFAAPGGETVRADLRTATGRSAASRALDAFLGAHPDGGVRVVAAGPLSLTDIPQNGLSIINRASVDDFARRIGRDVHPLRFRANLYLGGVPAWAERDWIGREVRIGAVTVKIAAHIERCNATRVDPVTAIRDLDTLRLLRDEYGHIELGVYADVVTDGELRVGDPVVWEEAPSPSAAATRLRRAGFYARNAWVLARSWLGG